MLVKRLWFVISHLYTLCTRNTTFQLFPLCILTHCPRGWSPLTKPSSWRPFSLFFSETRNFIFNSAKTYHGTVTLFPKDMLYSLTEIWTKSLCWAPHLQPCNRVITLYFDILCKLYLPYTIEQETSYAACRDYNYLTRISLPGNKYTACLVQNMEAQ